MPRAGHRPVPGLEEASVLERPRMLGGGSVGMASPALPPRARLLATRRQPRHDRRRRPASRGRSALEDARNHPYVRLALNGSFSALWVGQVISLFGDRINQLALIAFVFEITDSPVAVAITFIVSTIPNLLFSPVAGTLVDRWDQKQVLVVSDLLRAALVLMIPVAVLINVWLAYPLVFLITTVSIFFRPARIAILPRIVDERDLLSANSAMWVGETIADVINYPIAGLFVVFLASSLPLAFWFDAVTYLGSAVLLATIVVPPIVRKARPRQPRDAGPDVDGEAPSGRHPRSVDLADARRLAVPPPRGGPHGEHPPGHRRPVRGGRVHGLEHRAGEADHDRAPATSTGRPTRSWRPPSALGNLIGGFALGLVATRVRKGRLIIAAYVGLRGARVPGGQRVVGADRARAAVRCRRREHGVHHPEPDAVPGTHAARAHGSRRELPVRARVRRDVDRDGGRRPVHGGARGPGR